MDRSSIFIQQPPSFQFLSVCHYITMFGIYFYNNDLIKLEERNQSVPVLNTLFDYIDKSGNATQTKYQILKKVLKGSDLYGGGENETLDMKYVEETYQYIISTVLFSHYGNINGYLAKIVNEADNVNYLAFKEMILRHLSERYITKEYCSSENFSFRLSPLAIDKVYQEHILPIFPEPEEDISILDVSYIYAMVGLKIVNTIAAEVTNFTFQEYILISREIDLQDLNTETDQMVLKLLQIPALFYYAFNYKETFQKTDLLVLTDEFWKEAFEKLFSYINSSMRRIVNDNLEKSLHHKLERQLSKLQSRTSIAITVLQLYCKYESPFQVSELYIGMYKTLYRWLTKLFLPNNCDSDIPDLETLYNEQFEEVEKTYNEIERNSIEKVLVDSNLLDIMDVNSTVKLGQLPLPSTMGCHLCSPIPREMNKDIYLLFTIMRENEDSNYYALRQVNNTLSLLTSNGNELNFAKTVANDSSLKMDTGLIPTTLKFKHEDYKLFVQRVADIKTKQFISGLKMYYYDETLGEKYLNFFKSLIPFYNCIESATAGRGGEAAFSCSLDVLSLIPFAGLAAKYTAKISTSLSMNFGNMFLMTNTLSRAGIVTKLPFITSLKEISKMAIRTIANEIMNRGLVKDLVVASLRTMDPGFELFYKMSNAGFKALRKLLRSMLSNIKNIPIVEKIQNLLKSSLLRMAKQKRNSIPDITGLVPMVLAEFDGFDIVRYFYPGGSNFFGPRCISSLGISAELRSIEGSSAEIPVVPVAHSYKTFYHQYIPETGEVLKPKIKMNSNDILQRVGYLLDEMNSEGRNVKILRNYHVYHNTMEWKNAPINEKPTDDLSPPNEGDASPLAFVNRFNAREYVVQHSYRQMAGSQDQSNLPESNFKEPLLADTELASTSKGSVQSPNFPLITNRRYSESDSIKAVRNFPRYVNTELPGTSKETVPTGNYMPSSLDLLYSTSLRDLLNAGEKAPPVFNKFVLDTTATGPNAIQIIHLKNPLNFKNERFISPKSRKPQDGVTIFPETIKEEKIEDPKTPQYIHKKFDASVSKRKIAEPPEEAPVKNQHQDSSFADNAAKVKEQEDISKSVLNKENKKSRMQGKFDMENQDDIPGTSKQFRPKSDQNFYKMIIREPTYTRNVDIFLMWKNYGLTFLKQDKMKVDFLRTSLNKLALLQTELQISVQTPLKLWCTKIVEGQENIDVIRSLKQRPFFFNDITLLTDIPPGSIDKEKIFSFPVSIQVRYHLTFESSYGLVDLTVFNDKLQSSYATFNDVFFLVKDTFFSANKKILNVQLQCIDKSRDYWQFIRHNDLQSLHQEARTAETVRMTKIMKAANFMATNAPLSTLTASRDFLSNFILCITPSMTNIPTYDKLAIDFISMSRMDVYNKYKIKKHPYITDVLTKQNLDEVTDISVAKRRIHDVYDFFYFQNIEEAFTNYKNIPSAEQRFRFEDYYVLHSYIKHRMLINNHGMRRLEAAINRLALRQCDEEWIMNPIVLYRAEFITKDLSERLTKSLIRTNIVAFGSFKNFSPIRDVEVLKFLNNVGTSTQVPLLIEINVKNQAGIVDLSRPLNDDVLFHLTTAGLEFSLDYNLHYQYIYGQKVLMMKLIDCPTPYEMRMIKVANNLHEILSKDTKFYSELF